MGFINISEMRHFCKMHIFAAVKWNEMKLRYITYLIIILTVHIGCQCNESGSTSKIEQPKERIVDSGNLPGTWEPANESGILFHYVCPDRCAGGVLDYEGNCPICGKQLHHNTAYHYNNNNPTATPAADMALNEIRNTENDPPQSPNGIWHFICENGHGAGVEGTCSQCGAELIHNADYHTDSENEEPAQNALGAWHFVCPDGHDGGAGAPLNCDVCGKKLEHNDVYHQS